MTLSCGINRNVVAAAKNAKKMTHKQVNDWYKNKVLDQHQVNLLESAARELQSASLEIENAMKKRRGKGAFV